jgi:hypothetical protein
MRQPMRSPILMVLLHALCAAPLVAQSTGRVSIELVGGRSITSPVFTDEVIFASTARPVSYFESRRLAARSANNFGGRLSVGIGKGWSMFAGAGRGYGTYEYHYQLTATPTSDLGDFSYRSGPTASTSVDVGVSRSMRRGSSALTMEPEVVVGMDYLTVGSGRPVCFDPGYFTNVPMCFAPEKWERRYPIARAGAGLAAGYHLTPHVDVVLRGRYTVGTTSTKEQAFFDIRPEFQHALTPTSRTLRSGSLSAGMRFVP